jgi:hypothetical protein
MSNKNELEVLEAFAFTLLDCIGEDTAKDWRSDVNIREAARYTARVVMSELLARGLKVTTSSSVKLRGFIEELQTQPASKVYDLKEIRVGG